MVKTRTCYKSSFAEFLSERFLAGSFACTIIDGVLSLYHPDPMQLMMYLNNDLIETVPLDRSQLPIPGYLGKIKRQLKEKYHSLLMESDEKPDFLVVSMQNQNEQTDTPHPG